MMHTDGEMMVCSGCGAHVPKDTERTAEFVSTESQTHSKRIATDEDATYKGKPTVEVECIRCGNDRAYYTPKQRNSDDELPTTVLECIACGYRWQG
jgi:DNA-directed RNA polymerase subunit M